MRAFLRRLPDPSRCNTITNDTPVSSKNPRAWPLIADFADAYLELHGHHSARGARQVLPGRTRQHFSRRVLAPATGRIPTSFFVVGGGAGGGGDRFVRIIFSRRRYQGLSPARGKAVNGVPVQVYLGAEAVRSGVGTGPR